MLFIVITQPQFINDEHVHIRVLTDCGVDIVHLRKPNSDIDECRCLLDKLPLDTLQHIVIHDHYTLAEEYPIIGAHFSPRLSTPRPLFPFHSASCHSIAELHHVLTGTVYGPQPLKYAFLSPIFNSISKEGYNSNFTDEELARAADEGIINDRVIALGGCTLGNIPMLKHWHFGGVAFLGDVWSKVGSADFSGYLHRLKTALN